MNAIFETFASGGQGPLFWVAVASVALGVTMVVGAAVVQTRRLTRPRPATSGTEATAKVPEAAPHIRAVAEAGAAGSPDPVRRRERQREAARQTDRLVVLLSRLEEAAATLEEAAADPAPLKAEEPQPQAESDLKESPGGVEYVFRAAGG